MIIITNTENDFEFESIKFEFNEMELSALKLMAHFRLDHKVEEKNSEYYKSKIRAHYFGLAGEYAVAKAVNGFFDPLPKPEGDNHTGDVLADLDGSIRISVKTTGEQPPLFKVKTLLELEKVTHIALCHFYEPMIKIIWLKNKNYLLDNHFERSFSYGDRFCCY